MRMLKTSLLAGVAAAAIGLAGAASAQTGGVHVMTVQLPGGGVAQIQYTGNIAPRVSFGEAPAPIAAFAPMPAFFGAGSPFATLDRISAEMDREAAAMFRQTAALAAEARSGQLTEAAMRDLPPGSRSYSYVSTMSGNGVCSESVEITSQGNGAPPRVVSHRSGNCAGVAGPAGTVNLPNAAPPGTAARPVWTSAPATAPYVAPAAPARPDMVWTAAHGQKPYAGLVKPIPPAER